MDDYVIAAMREWRVPGLAVAVVKDGTLLVARGYGVRKLGAEDRVTADTVFPIASCTKSFTAAAAAMFVDEGLLEWDDPVRRHFPEFRVANDYVARHATIRDLLSHRTGLVAGHLLFVKGDLPPNEILQRMSHLGQARPFRTQHTYNNVAYLVVGETLRRVSGTPWPQLMRERLLRPLKMHSTFTSHTAVPEGRLAIRHRHYNEGILPMRTPSTDDLVGPAAAIQSTVGDLATWLQFHLQSGQFEGRRLVQKRTMREMHALQKSIPVPWDPDTADVYRPRFVGTGLGWFTRDYRGRKVVEHGGGWGAEMALVPADNLGVVVLSNLDRNGLVWMLKWDLIDAVVAGPEVAWNREGKWKKWKRIGGLGHQFRFRDKEKRRLEGERVRGTKPSQPLSRFEGRFESPLYGAMTVRSAGRDLDIQFGLYSARLTHWQNDTFYGVACVEPFLDWLVKFEFAGQPADDKLEIVSVGWKDPDERHFYHRAESRQGRPSGN